MRIESQPQLSPEYRKSATQPAGGTFRQMMKASAQDRYVPAANTQSTESMGGME